MTGVESVRWGFNLQIDTRLLLDAVAAVRDDHTGLIDPVAGQPVPGRSLAAVRHRMYAHAGERMAV
jgi:hypothetical protein